MNIPFSNAARVLAWDPVLKRELLAGLRSARIRWILVLYLVMPFMAVMSKWPSGQVYYGGSQLARGVWETFLGVQIALIVLLTPVFSAYSISSEYEQDTVEFLWTTAVPPWRVVLSKMLAIVLLVTALMLTSVPGLSTVFFLGGVGSAEIMNGYGLLLGLAASITALGTFYSACVRKGHTSLWLSYVTMFGIVIWFGPCVALATRNGPGLLFLLSLSALVFGWLACLKGSQPVGEIARPNFKPIDDPRLLHARRHTWPYYLMDPLRRHPPIADDANVVAAHEDQVHPLLRTSWSYRILLYPQLILGIPCCLGLAMGGSDSTDRMVASIWWVNLVGIAPWTILVHAISMTMEQETRTFDALRLTIITPMDWLKGKWRISLQNRWPMMIFGIGTIGLVNLLAKCPWPLLVWALVSWVLCVEALGLITFAIASFCTRTMFAIALSVVGGFVVPWALFGVVDFLGVFPPTLTYILGLSPCLNEGSPANWSTEQTFFLQTLSWALGGGVAWLIAMGNVRRRWKTEVLAL